MGWVFLFVLGCMLGYWVQGGAIRRALAEASRLQGLRTRSIQENNRISAESNARRVEIINLNQALATAEQKIRELEDHARERAANPPAPAHGGLVVLPDHCTPEIVTTEGDLSDLVELVRFWKRRFYAEQEYHAHGGMTDRGEPWNETTEGDLEEMARMDAIGRRWIPDHSDMAEYPLFYPDGTRFPSPDLLLAGVTK